MCPWRCWIYPRKMKHGCTPHLSQFQAQLLKVSTVTGIEANSAAGIHFAEGCFPGGTAMEGLKKKSEQHRVTHRLVKTCRLLVRLPHPHPTHYRGLGSVTYRRMLKHMDTKDQSLFRTVKHSEPL